MFYVTWTMILALMCVMQVADFYRCPDQKLIVKPKFRQNGKLRVETLRKLRTILDNDEYLMGLKTFEEAQLDHDVPQQTIDELSVAASAISVAPDLPPEPQVSRDAEELVSVVSGLLPTPTGLAPRRSSRLVHLYNPQP